MRQQDFSPMIAINRNGISICSSRASWDSPYIHQKQSRKNDAFHDGRKWFSFDAWKHYRILTTHYGPIFPYTFMCGGCPFDKTRA